MIKEPQYKHLYVLSESKKVTIMAMNYNKLWKLLIDRGLIKKDLREMAGLSTNVIAKMGKNGDVSTEVLRKICKALDCGLDDIVEIVPDEDSES
ncbi:predicted transcriptional regulator [Clostridium sp. SY8519]|nr:predicted transcriptional regulator [Clostridium sp. SY8519]